MDLLGKHGVGGTGNRVVDDIIAAYVISSNGAISAGALCEFINGQIRTTYQTTAANNVLQTFNDTTHALCACVLSPTQILLAYTNYNDYLYVIPINVSGGTLSVGASPLQLATYSGTITIAAMLKISSSQAIIMFSMGASFGMVLNVSGNTITKMSPVSYSDTWSSVANLQLVNSTTILMVYAKTNSSGLGACIATISGSTLSFGTPVTLSSNATSPYGLTCDLMSPTLAIVNYVTGGYIQYAFVLNISGTTLTQGAQISINSPQPMSLFSAKLDESHIMVGTYNSNNSKATFMVQEITKDGPIIITMAATKSAIMYYIAMVPMTKTSALVVYNQNNTGYYAFVVHYEGSQITFGTDTQLLSSAITLANCVTVQPQTAMITYRNSLLYSMLISTNGLVVTTTIITHDTSPQVIALSGGGVGSTISCLISGIAKIFSGLTPGTTYYCSTSGSITTTVTPYKIGVAISPTELLVKNPWWERW